MARGSRPGGRVEATGDLVGLRFLREVALADGALRLDLLDKSQNFATRRTFRFRRDGKLESC